MTYRPQNRFLKSLLVAALLGGIYGGFRLLTSPFLDVIPKQYVSSSMAPVITTKWDEDAGKWFPNHSWVQDANEQYFDSGRVLYCESSQLSDDNQSVVVRPLAMRWRDSEADDTEVPMTLVADAAQLRLDSPVSSKSTSIGHIRRGRMSGSVQISGPRGLKITGHDFTVDADSMKLWSDRPVQFQWEGHRGTAEGMELYLKSPGPDAGLEKVSDIRRMRLLRRVNVHIRIPARRVDEDDIELLIAAANGFTLDALTKTGRFNGFPESASSLAKSRRKLVKDEQVWVRQVDPKDSTTVLNQLVCPELELTFRNRFSLATGKTISRKIELERLKAWGRLVLFHSAEYDAYIEGNDFQYAVDERRIDIRNTPIDVAEQARPVTVIGKTSRLTVPHLVILHSSEGSGVSRVECNGPGRLEASGDLKSKKAGRVRSKRTPAPTRVTATWQNSLTMQTLSDQTSRIVTLLGQATAAVPDREVGLGAEQISVKLLEDAGSNRMPDHGRSSQSAGMDLGNLHPEKLIASQNVRLDSPQGSGTLRDTLTIDFLKPAPNSIRQASAANKTSDAKKKRRESDGDIEFTANTLEAKVRLQSGETEDPAQFEDVWLKGDVTVERQSVDTDKSFEAVGNALFAAGGLDNDSQIQLFGAPARLTSAGRKLEGPRIDLVELDGRAEVVGSGRIRFMTPRGIRGEILAEPMPIDIYWSDRMEFRKRSAEFLGNIRVVMTDGVTQDLQLTCAGMTVHFAQDITLGETTGEDGFAAIASPVNGNDDEGPIERIECHNHVDVHIEEFLEGVINARHHGDFADLDVHMMTGEFRALGPGTLESVSPDQDAVLQGSAPPVATANASARADTSAFIHVKVSFIGNLVGNLHQRTATLTQNVLALVTSARRVDETIDLQHIPTDELPKRAGILQAEQLTISAHDVPQGAPPMFSIVARENARLRSLTMAASADVIVYDTSKEQFIIRAEGEGLVTVNYRQAEHEQFNRFSGSRFEWYRRSNRLKANEIDRLNYRQ